MRVVTNRSIFKTPSELSAAIDFVSASRDQPNFVPVNPGPRHWDIFIHLCQEVGATGGLIQDAYLAALAIGTGDTWITADSDFNRFPGLRWRHPLSS
jgi:toxin-antitoxin system PIN domain toxin